MGKRIGLILFFPFIAFLFILGWILTIIGDRQKTNPKRKTEYKIPEEEPTKNSYLEMGIITKEERKEEQVC